MPLLGEPGSCYGTSCETASVGEDDPSIGWPPVAASAIISPRTIAAFAGDKTSLEMQRLLNSAAWDQDKIRDRLVRYVAAEVSDPGGGADRR